MIVLSYARKYLIELGKLGSVPLSELPLRIRICSVGIVIFGIELVSHILFRYALTSLVSKLIDDVSVPPTDVLDARLRSVRLVKV